MNPISINKHQMARLAEMTRSLFKEFLYIDVVEIPIDGGHPTVKGVDSINSNPVFVILSEIEKVPHDDCRAFPWLEFCITKLVSKISFKLEFEEIPTYVGNILPIAKGGKWTFYSNFFFHFPKNVYEIHPVDYIYAYFKTIKN